MHMNKCVYLFARLCLNVFSILVISVSNNYLSYHTFIYFYAVFIRMSYTVALLSILSDI